MNQLLNNESDPFNILPLLTKNLQINNLCECKVYYRSILFKNKCSKCFEKEYPDLYFEINFNNNLRSYIKNKKYSKNYLENYTELRQLPDNHYMFKTLKLMFSNGSILQDNNFLNWLEFLKKQTNYQGISTKQALELTYCYKNSHINYINKSNIYNIQHLICGLVVDWWYLFEHAKIVGACSCYYSGFGIPSKINTKIKPANAFMDKCQNKNCKEYCKRSFSCDLDHYKDYYKFWIDNAFHVIFK
ncbi:hypothetical protein CPAV1605_160 [seawater metagenome]|uniref:Uncharacterized protein n=1 Tax=seawater metagenome TaxID=1561972 RepID=A0A5E8CG98_9ZZZZ